MSHPINDMIGVTMNKIREMVDVNTIIGTPIETGTGITIIPVSKVSMGFGTGGSDFATKNQKSDADNAFGGGGGAGVAITPVGFLVIQGDNVRLLPVDEPASTTLDRAVEMVPQVMDRITTMVDKKKAEKAAKAAQEVIEEVIL